MYRGCGDRNSDVSPLVDPRRSSLTILSLSLSLPSPFLSPHPRALLPLSFSLSISLSLPHYSTPLFFSPTFLSSSHARPRLLLSSCFIRSSSLSLSLFVHTKPSRVSHTLDDHQRQASLPRHVSTLLRLAPSAPALGHTSPPSPSAPLQPHSRKHFHPPAGESKVSWPGEARRREEGGEGGGGGGGRSWVGYVARVPEGRGRPPLSTLTSNKGGELMREGAPADTCGYRPTLAIKPSTDPQKTLELNAPRPPLFDRVPPSPHTPRKTRSFVCIYRKRERERERGREGSACVHYPTKISNRKFLLVFILR